VATETGVMPSRVMKPGMAANWSPKAFAVAPAGVEVPPAHGASQTESSSPTDSHT
jgi:hypothetical protein